MLACFVFFFFSLVLYSCGYFSILSFLLGEKSDDSSRRIDAQVAIWGSRAIGFFLQPPAKILLFGDRLGLSLEIIYVFCLMAVMLKLNKVK